MNKLWWFGGLLLDLFVLFLLSALVYCNIVGGMR